MANVIHNNFLGLLLSGDIDLNGDTIKFLFTGATYDGVDTNDNVGDVGTLGELSGTGYVAAHGGAGRHTIVNPTITVDDPNNQAEFDCDDEQWSSIDAGTIETVMLHRAGTANDTDAKIVGTYDVSQVTNGGDITLGINAEGLLKLTRAAGS